MPKVKWGGDLDTDAINEADNRGGEYTGDIPTHRAVYRFKLRFSQKGLSKEKNPKLLSLLVLDGSWKKEHKKYDGCPLWDHMPVSKKTAFRVRAYCDALNISAADFMGKMVVDDEGFVQKIGSLKVADQDLLVYVKCGPEEDKEYGTRLTFGKNGGYLPFKEDADEGDESDEDTDADDGDGDGEEGDPF